MMWTLVLAGLVSLKEYIALHLLTCLVPAFLLAGAMVTFISRQAIIEHLGHAASKAKSFTTAAVGSFFIAACSCTVIPVSAGLYYGGGAIGPAFIVLWVAPAANILALIYTGTILGGSMVAARIIAAIVMAFLVGWVMTYVFRSEEKRRAGETSSPTGPVKIVAVKDLVLILLVVISLLAPNYIVRRGAYPYKILVWFIATLVLALYVWKVKTRAEVLGWMRETWWFVRIIFPLLLLGVFIVGVIGAILPETWIQKWLGGAGLLASFLATLIGAISYFATMTEAPFVDTLIKLGMGKGPALALLLTGPGLSLPNWLAIARVFGVKKAVVYVVTIVILGTAVGWFAGQSVFSY